MLSHTHTHTHSHTYSKAGAKSDKSELSVAERLDNSFMVLSIYIRHSVGGSLILFTAGLVLLYAGGRKKL